MNSWPTAFSQMSALELCRFFRSSSLTTRVPSPICIGTDPAAPGVVEWWIPWLWFRDESNVEKWLPKTFSLWSLTYSMYRVASVSRRSRTQSVFLVRIGRVFEHVALRHLLFFGSVPSVLRIFPMQTQPSHQAYRSRGNRFAPQSIAMS